MAEDVLTPAEQLFFTVVFLVINFVITVVSVIFIVSFIKLKEKSIGMWMILILTLSDFSFVLMNVVTVLLELNLDPTWDNWLYFAAVIEFGFSLYWSAAIALFTYKILAVKDPLFNAKAFLWKALLSVSLIVCYGPFLIIFNISGIGIKSLAQGFSTVAFESDNPIVKYTGWCLFNVVGIFSPMVAIYYCYSRVYKSLKSGFDGLVEYNEISSSRVFIYVIIPVVCFAPWCLTDLYTAITGVEVPFVVILLVAVPRRAWGFLNLLAYWFLSPGHTGGRFNDDESIDELDTMEGNIQKPLIKAK